MPGCDADEDVSTLSIVVPCLNEASGIAATLAALQPLRHRGVQVIVVDGGSTDATVEIARRAADQVLIAPRGRASQMNAGAGAATGEVLLFLHADCILPPDAERLIVQGLAASGRRWGRFDVRLVGRHPMLPVIATMMNLRSRMTTVATGDQGIFVTRELFRALGGYASIALMEDVALTKQLRRHGPPLCLEARMAVSARRWEEHGPLRTLLLMWRLRLAYFLGADPSGLALRYQRSRRIESTRVLVFAKAPVPGTVKTRLIPALGPERAAALQQMLIEHALATALAAGVGKVELWCAPSASDPLFRQYGKHPDVVLASQSEGDLGERMSHAAAAVLRDTARVIIIGSDCPALTAAHLRDACAKLARYDAVFVPAEDGGYALIALRRWNAELFRDVPWSTERVMAVTRERLRGLGWRWHELAPVWDVDRPDDYERLLASGLMPALNTISAG